MFAPASVLFNDLTMTKDRIRDFRKSRDLTQGQFADLLGVKGATVAMWEGGQEPSGASRKLLEYLIDGRDPFAGSPHTPAPWEVELSLDEFEELQQRARRLGFGNVRQYITHIVRQSLAAPAGRAKRKRLPAKSKR